MLNTVNILILLISVMLAGCDNSGSGPSGKPEGTTESSHDYISIKGSDTMVHLTSAWAENYMSNHSGSQISVTGGGSGTGIAALLNGTTDICAASRKIREKEVELGGQKGIKIEEFAVAMDGIALIVNPANPVGALSLAQIRGIFTGAYKNWQEVGGSDTPIIVLSRESSSGTFVFFQEHVLDRADYTANARLLPGTSALVQAVSADAGAIAYVGMGFIADAGQAIKVVNVGKTESDEAVDPTEQTVRAGEYPIARPLYLYVNGAPQGLVKDFIDFCLSDDGQRIVRETGYVTIK